MKAVLTYHSVDESGSVISVDARTFRRHVGWLARSGVPVVPLAELAELPSDTDAIALTFDDGFANFGDVAAPLLLEHNLPATLFVVTDCVGATNVWPAGADAGIPVMPLLGWESLGRLTQQGISIGAHTRTHPRLDLVSNEVAQDEIIESRRRLARELGIEPQSFAYPYGSVTPYTRDVVAGNFRCGVSTRFSALDAADDVAQLPRLDSYYFRAPGTLEAWGTRRFRVRMGILAGARTLRRTLARSVSR
jgi:peptidoglycan/xylan/chitin deacetylase (PgdA/CDA1 family)